ncbi:MAG: DUF1641 domain-containing protein [Halobacteriaceae archaeon]
MADTPTDAGLDPVAGAVEDNPEEVARLIRRLGLVNEVLDATDLALEALDDEMVAALSDTGESLGHVADAASDPDTARALEQTLTALGAASASEPAPVGTLGLLRALRDPEVQRGLGFLLAVARETGREMSGEPDEIL